MRVLEHHPALPPTPRCPEHQQRFDGCCEECGTFRCRKCGAGKLCASCARRVPGIASAVVRHEGRRLLADRASAAFLDGALTTLVWLALLLAVRAGPLEPPMCATLGALPLLFLAYHTFAEGLLGATLFKSLLGLRVVDGRGRTPGLARALRRNLYRLVQLPLVLPVLALAHARPTLQHPGDVWAGTFVLPARTLPRPVSRP